MSSLSPAKTAESRTKSATATTTTAPSTSAQSESIHPFPVPTTGNSADLSNVSLAATTDTERQASSKQSVRTITAVAGKVPNIFRTPSNSKTVKKSTNTQGNVEDDISDTFDIGTYNSLADFLRYVFNLNATSSADVDYELSQRLTWQEIDKTSKDEEIMELYAKYQSAYLDGRNTFWIRCLACDHFLRFTKRYSATNLRVHSGSCKGVKPAPTNRLKFPDMSSSGIKRLKQRRTANKKQIAQAMVKCAADRFPFSMIERSSVRKALSLVHKLGYQLSESRQPYEDIAHSLPKRMTVQRATLGDVERVEQLNARDCTVNGVNGISFTCDFSTDQMTNFHLGCVTTDLILLPQFVIKSIVLYAGVTPFGRLDMPAVVNWLEPILNKHGGSLYSKRTTLVTDSASNFTAIHSGGGKKQTRAVPDSTHIRCMGHIMSNLVNAAFAQLQKEFPEFGICFDAIKKFVKFIRVTGMNSLLPKGKRLIQHCPTRWLSHFLMLKRFIFVYDDAVSLIKKIKPGEMRRLDGISIPTAQLLVDHLEPWNAAVVKLQGDLFPTLPLVLPRLTILAENIQRTIRQIDTDCLAEATTIITTEAANDDADDTIDNVANDSDDSYSYESDSDDDNDSQFDDDDVDLSKSSKNVITDGGDQLPGINPGSSEMTARRLRDASLYFATNLLTRIDAVMDDPTAIKLRHFAAVIMDPRLKTKLKKMYNVTAEMEEKAFNYVKDLMHEQLKRDLDIVHVPSSSPPAKKVKPANAGTSDEIDYFCGDDDDVVDSPTHVSDAREIVDAEFNKYMNVRISSSDNVTTCKWWRNNLKEYSIMHKVAADVLSTPATETGSERAFSTTKMMCDPRRANLHAPTVHGLTVLHSYHKNVERQENGEFD